MKVTTATNETDATDEGLRVTVGVVAKRPSPEVYGNVQASAYVSAPITGLAPDVEADSDDYRNAAYAAGAAAQAVAMNIVAGALNIPLAQDEGSGLLVTAEGFAFEATPRPPEDDKKSAARKKPAAKASAKSSGNSRSNSNSNSGGGNKDYPPTRWWKSLDHDEKAMLAEAYANDAAEEFSGRTGTFAKITLDDGSVIAGHIDQVTDWEF